MSRTELLMRTLRGCSMKISGLSKVSWSGKDNKKTGTYTIWYNRREDGKHQQGVIFARESQTVKALIKIILSIRWYSLIYVLVKEEHLLCKGCATQAAEVGSDAGGFHGSPMELKGSRAHLWIREVTQSSVKTRSREDLRQWWDSPLYYSLFLSRKEAHRGRPRCWGESTAAGEIIWKRTNWEKYVYIPIYIFIYIKVYTCINSYLSRDESTNDVKLLGYTDINDTNFLHPETWAVPGTEG